MLSVTPPSIAPQWPADLCDVELSHIRLADAKEPSPRLPFGEDPISTPLVATRPVAEIVGAATIGGFMYLRGRSGKRYVFSRINGDQAALYQRALFALIDTAGNVLGLASRSEGLPVTGGRLHVHLLGEEDSDTVGAIDDILTSPARIG